jgi:hypothetical protein
LKFLKENGFPARYQRAIHPRATSDDEVDKAGLKINNQPVYWIKRRPERSVEAETFIRRLEEIREESVRYSPKGRWRERVRCVPNTGQEVSTFLKLPEKMPIDYFQPAFYNRLLPRLRFTIAQPSIIFLPDGQAPFAGTADEKLSEKRFNKKYGPTVLSRYDLATEEDFADNEDDDDEDEMDLDDNLGDEEFGPGDDESEGQSEGQPGDGGSESEVESGMVMDEDEGGNGGASGSVERNKKRRRSR